MNAIAACMQPEYYHTHTQTHACTITRTHTHTCTYNHTYTHTHTHTHTHTLYSHEHIEILVVKNELLFFRQRDGPYLPTLRLLHKCEFVVFCSGIFTCHGSIILCHSSVVLCHDVERIPSPPSSLFSRPHSPSSAASRQGGHQVHPEWGQHHVSWPHLARCTDGHPCP